MTQTNVNIQNLAKELSKIIDQNIVAEDIQPRTIESTLRKDSKKILPGYPMIKNFSHDGFHVIIHPNDFTKIQSGEISVQDYILQSTWLIKYAATHRTHFYQTSYLLEQQEELRQDIKIWLCSSARPLSVAFPKVKKCNACTVKPCPISPYKLTYTGTMYLYIDPATGQY